MDPRACRHEVGAKEVIREKKYQPRFVERPRPRSFRVRMTGMDLFNQHFFKLAFGFVATIVLSVGLMLLLGYFKG